MKFFTLIFSFCMLGLSFMPCGDVDECNASEDIVVSSGQGQEKHSHEKEDCTPLCHCACCATTVCFQQIAVYKICSTTFPVKKYPLYNLSYSSHSTANIWQPPRI
jgi:hypothetical protein